MLSSSKLLLIFGATGNQGGSVVEYVAKNPVLSKEFKIRAVTRDTSKPAAQELIKLGNVEVVQGDLEDSASLRPALHGAHTVFVPTATIYDDQLEEHELRQGKNAADAAVAAGASYIIYSSQPNIAKLSGRKYKKCIHFDSKNAVEQYIRTLPIQCAFFVPGGFMQEFSTDLIPQPVGDGTYVLANIVVPTTDFPLINIKDTGKFVGAALADPDAFHGKAISASNEVLTWEAIALALSKASGKTVVYKQITVDEYQRSLPPISAEFMTEMMFFFQDFDYYGPNTRKQVAQAVANARGELVTFEEFLEQTNYTLP